MKPRKSPKPTDKEIYYNEISQLIQQYVCIANELKDPLRDFFDLAKKAQKQPDLLPAKHPAESILQDLVETDNLLRGKLRHAFRVINYEVVKAVREFLPHFNARDVTPQELNKFLETAVANSNNVVKLIEFYLSKSIGKN